MRRFKSINSLLNSKKKRKSSKSNNLNSKKIKRRHSVPSKFKYKYKNNNLVNNKIHYKIELPTNICYNVSNSESYFELYKNIPEKILHVTLENPDNNNIETITDLERNYLAEHKTFAQTRKLKIKLNLEKLNIGFIDEIFIEEKYIENTLNKKYNFKTKKKLTGKASIIDRYNNNKTLHEAIINKYKSLKYDGFYDPKNNVAFFFITSKNTKYFNIESIFVENKSNDLLYYNTLLNFIYNRHIDNNLYKNFIKREKMFSSPDPKNIFLKINSTPINNPSLDIFNSYYNNLHQKKKLSKDEYLKLKKSDKINAIKLMKSTFLERVNDLYIENF